MPQIQYRNRQRVPGWSFRGRDRYVCLPSGGIPEHHLRGQGIGEGDAYVDDRGDGSAKPGRDEWVRRGRCFRRSPMRRDVVLELLETSAPPVEAWPDSAQRLATRAVV